MNITVVGIMTMMADIASTENTMAMMTKRLAKHLKVTPA